MDRERPSQGALTSSEMYRMNSTAHKVGDVFNDARREARDECLWLSALCQRLLEDNDRLRLEVSFKQKRIDELERRKEE